MRQLRWVWFVSVVTATVSSAQAVTPRELTGRPVVIEEAFSDLSQLVELADGRVLVYDAIERRLEVVNFANGERIRVTTEGAGPQEYRSVNAALRVAGDSVLLWDPRNDRVLALAPDGRVVGTWPSEGRSPRGIRLVRAYPRAVDARGNLYANEQRPTDGDTVTLIRVQFADGRVDTLTRSPLPQIRPERAGPGVVRVRVSAFPPIDAWGVFPDGRVLVVRGAGYRPEIIAPDGRVQRVAALSYTPVAVTGAMRRAQVNSAVRELQRRLLREAGTGRATTLPRVEPVEPETWPTHMPALASSVIHVDAKSRAWVQVTDASEAARYDLLDVGGRRVASLRLPAGARLVGLGREFVYVTTEDADGLLALQRYPMP